MTRAARWRVIVVNDDFPFEDAMLAAFNFCYKYGMPNHTFRIREQRIEEIRAASLLDAVFICSRYNERERRLDMDAARGPAPAIDLAEVLPDITPDAYEDALKLVANMERGANKVAMAFYEYDTANRSYEEEHAAWLADNPGFNSMTYAWALHRELIAMR